VLLVGCAHYEPKPFAPAETLRQLQSRRLTDEAVVARVQAATASPITWDRAQLLVAALELNPALAEARAQLEQAAAGVVTAQAIENPAVSLSAEYDLSRAGEPPWLWGFGTGFLLDTFLSRPHRIHLAQAGVRGAHADYSEAVWTVRHDLRAALLGVVIARKRIDALELDVRQRAELARLARSRVAAGESARSEESQAHLELSRAQAALDDARRSLSEGQGILARALGVSLEAVEQIAPSWQDLERLDKPDDATLHALREQALLSRPDLERAIADYEARDIELRQQVGSQYLQTSLGPGYTWDHGVRKVTLGGSFALPVFNRNEGPIREANAARETAGAHAVVVQSKILSEIDTAAAAYATALAALERIREQRALNESLEASARRAFDADVSDKPTWLAAGLAVSTDRIAEIDALERAQQALGQLEDALRTPLSGPETRLRTLESP
jgi:outer membrane protein TolC